MHNYTDHRWVRDSRTDAVVRPTRCFMCAHKGHDKKCENSNPTTKEKHPFFFYHDCCLREEYSTHQLKKPLIIFQGVESVRASESERDVGFELIL